MNLNETYNPNATTSREIHDNQTKLHTIIKNLSTRSEYDENCKDALSTFEDLRADLRREINQTLISATSSKSILSKEFLWEGPRYAILLIYSGLILVIIATGLKYLAAPAVEIAVKYVERLLGLVR
jgi:hypothetical protein